VRESRDDEDDDAAAMKRIERAGRPGGAAVAACMRDASHPGPSQSHENRTGTGHTACMLLPWPDGRTRSCSSRDTRMSSREQVGIRPWRDDAWRAQDADSEAKKETGFCFLLELPKRDQEARATGSS
jgi:hypothetical protein